MIHLKNAEQVLHTRSAEEGGGMKLNERAVQLCDAMLHNASLLRIAARSIGGAHVIDAGIDGFFDKYGEFTLRELLDELGIGREIMRREALRFAPPVLATLHEKGLLEPYVRRHLEGFYRSDAALAILSKRDD